MALDRIFQFYVGHAILIRFSNVELDNFFQSHVKKFCLTGLFNTTLDSAVGFYVWKHLSNELKLLGLFV
jgi:hypothetical protein